VVVRGHFDKLDPQYNIFGVRGSTDRVIGSGQETKRNRDDEALTQGKESERGVYEGLRGTGALTEVRTIRN
jgi:hypothetical protein